MTTQFRPEYEPNGGTTGLCPTCGEPVQVASSDEGTPHYESVADKWIAALRLAIREHRNQTERDFSADITIADERLWKVLG